MSKFDPLSTTQSSQIGSLSEQVNKIIEQDPAYIGVSDFSRLMFVSNKNDLIPNDIPDFLSPIGVRGSQASFLTWAYKLVAQFSSILDPPYIIS